MSQPPDSSPAGSALDLHELLAAVGGVIHEFFPTPLWVRCEITKALPHPKRFWALEIQDPVLGKEAQGRVMVWRAQVPRIIDAFTRAVGRPPEAGMQVLLQVQVEFSGHWGMSLVATAIDPQFTLGQAQQAQEQLRQQLQAQGVWDLNRQLPAPQGYARVALVAPGGSAGLGDVQAETQRLEAAGVCTFEVFSAAFEGPNAVRELPAVLARLTDPARFDAVCLVRGGGGTAGLQTVNQAAIVEAVCRCPLPVIVGVGHERDHTLLDEVAWKSLGTPSKAIGFIAQTIVQQARHAQGLWDLLEREAHRRLDEAQIRVRQWREEAHRRTEQQLAQAEARVQQAQMAVRHRSAQVLDQADQAVRALGQAAMSLGPAATLARGYAWVQGPEGPITRAHAVSPQTPWVIHFHDGTVPVVTAPESTP